MVTIKIEEHVCTHPKESRFIQEYLVNEIAKELVMCRDCGKVVKSKIIKKL